jgi:flagellin
MAMIVKHNMQAMNSNRTLGVNSSTLAKSTEKLSSGYKINRAADDAAGLSISEKMRRQVRGLTQASANAQDGVSMVQTAEGALNEVHDMLQRLNELAVKANNGTLQSEDVVYIDDEVKQLVSEIDRTANDTKFNKLDLLNTSGTYNLQVGAESGQTISVQMSKMDASTIGVKTLTEDYAISTGEAIDNIDKAIQSVSRFRSSLGAVQNRLEHTINNLDNVAENTQAAEARIRDTDMATEMVKYSNNQILAQAGQAMLAQANQANQGVLSLLQ